MKPFYPDAPIKLFHYPDAAMSQVKNPSKYPHPDALSTTVLQNWTLELMLRPGPWASQPERSDQGIFLELVMPGTWLEARRTCLYFSDCQEVAYDALQKLNEELKWARVYIRTKPDP